MKSVFTLLFLVFVSVPASPSAGQTDKGSTTAAEVPATGPSSASTRSRVVIPPGFIMVEAAERTALCEPADKDWIVKALNELQPSARPTTMPSDLADTLNARREELIGQMSSDLGVTDIDVIKKLFADQVIPDLNKMADIRPPMFYLVCTKARLLELMTNGWSDRRFHYNRVANDVAVYQNVDLSIQHAMDDLLIPALYESTMSLEKKKETFQTQVDRNEANIAASLAMQGLIMLQTGLVAAIDESAVKPLGLKPGQEWFGIGIEGFFSTRYMSKLNGMRNEDLLRLLTDDDPRNPIRATTINLLHPTSPDQLKPAYAVAYVDALRRRAVLVVNGLMQRIQPDALPKILSAIKESQPKGAEELITLLKQFSGVDLSRDVLPQ